MEKLEPHNTDLTVRSTHRPPVRILFEVRAIQGCTHR